MPASTDPSATEVRGQLDSILCCSGLISQEPWGQLTHMCSPSLLYKT